MKTLLKVLLVLWALLTLAALIFHDKLPMFLTGLVYEIATEKSHVDLIIERSRTESSITGKHVDDRLYLPVRGSGYSATINYIYTDFSQAEKHRELVHVLNVNYDDYKKYKNYIAEFPQLVWNLDDGLYPAEEIVQGHSFPLMPPYDNPKPRGINNFVTVSWKQHFVIAEILKSPLYALTPALDVLTAPIQIFLEALGSFRVGP